MKITATGGGPASNLTATGATLSGSNVTLEADNAVTLQSAQNTTTQTSSSSGSKQTLGASYSVGAQNGFTIDVGASQSKGSGNGRDVRQVNTYVDADNSVTIRSGGDTTLSGAVLTADTVRAPCVKIVAAFIEPRTWRRAPCQTGGRFIWQEVGCALTYESQTTSDRKP